MKPAKGRPLSRPSSPKSAPSRLSAKASADRRLGGFSSFYVWLAVAAALALVGTALVNTGPLAQRPVNSNLKLADIPVSGDRAYTHLKEICAIGPRVSGTEGMRRQQEYLR